MTKDGYIPWKLFWTMYEAQRHTEAMSRLTQTRATAHGIALAMSGDDPKVKELTRSELREAYAGE